MIRLVILSLMFISCASTPVIYTVEDVNYPQLSYTKRLEYTLSLIKANKLNYYTAISNRFVFKKIIINDKDSTGQLPILTNTNREK